MQSGNAPAGAVTNCLDEIEQGQDGAVEALWSLVSEEIRTMAESACRREARMVTLQPTAVINEVFLRLHGATQAQTWNNRAHFFGSVARAIGQILIDTARKRITRNHVESDSLRHADLLDQPFGTSVSQHPDHMQIVLDAVNELARIHPRAGEVVRLRWMMDLDRTLTATLLGVTTRTVRSDWRFAQAWLRSRLGDVM